MSRSAISRGYSRLPRSCEAISKDIFFGVNQVSELLTVRAPCDARRAVPSPPFWRSWPWIMRDERMGAGDVVVIVAARAVRGEEAAAYAENDESFALIGEMRRRRKCGIV